MSATLTIKIINQSDNALPVYATPGASGMDIRSFLPAPVILQPLERSLIPTGLFVEIPEGYEIQVRPRSGLAFKHGITCLNTPGTIDADYRGEIKVLLINHGDEPFIFRRGERIAQMVFQIVPEVNLIQVDELSATVRGAGGFGHTGRN